MIFAFWECVRHDYPFFVVSIANTFPRLCWLVHNFCFPGVPAVSRLCCATLPGVGAVGEENSFCLPLSSLGQAWFV